MYDLIIIGAGPAGLTAAIYARRADLSVLMIEKSTLGGQITYSPKIENYPGYEQISGMELADKLTEQSLALGTEMEISKVIGISSAPGCKTVKTEDGEFESKAVIIATGAEHRRIGVEREEEFVGNGISFCATCDGAFYKGENIAMVGGGSSALQEAILLSETVNHVTVVQNLDFLTGEKKLQDIISGKDNIDVIYGTIVESLLIKDEKFAGIKVKNVKTGETKDLYENGMFVAIGLVPKNDIFAETVELTENGYIKADETCLTSAEGIFVAGDCRSKKIRQITTACGDGATAAMTAAEYIKSR